MLKSYTENMVEWFEEGDVLVVDRGFRDVADLLQESDIKGCMSHFFAKSLKQMTTEEAYENICMVSEPYKVGQRNS